MRNGQYEMVKAPSHFPGKHYRGKYCYEHVLVWWVYNKTVPSSDEIVHHLDRNKLNNTIENLSLQSRSEHAKHHGFEQQTTTYIIACANCRKIFIRTKRKQGLQFCSRACIGKFGFSSKIKKRRHVSIKVVRGDVLKEVKQEHKLDDRMKSLYAKWFPKDLK